MAKELTLPELELLLEMPAPFDESDRFNAGWRTPMEVGGVSRSNHSKLLCNLAQQGLLERRQRRGGVIQTGSGVKPAGGYRGSWLYRITPAGMQLAAAARLYRKQRPFLPAFILRTEDQHNEKVCLAAAATPFDAIAMAEHLVDEGPWEYFSLTSDTPKLYELQIQPGSLGAKPTIATNKRT